MRPLERRILQLEAAGVEINEIAMRFRRSPEHIRRVIRLANLPGRTGSSSERDGLRAIERTVLSWRERDVGYAEIGRRFNRSGDHMRRIEGMALYKQSVKLLGS